MYRISMVGEFIRSTVGDDYLTGIWILWNRRFEAQLNYEHPKQGHGFIN